MTGHLDERCFRCHQPLSFESTGAGWTVFCGYGPCKLVPANTGATGRTQEEALAAYKALEDQLCPDCDGNGVDEDENCCPACKGSGLEV